MSAFEILGLRVGLVISDEEIREAFRVRAAVLHPDSGGDEQEFAKLQAARDVLLSPAKRIKAWLSARGMEADARGQIEGGLMDLFQKVSEVGAASEILIRENADAKSALVKAIAEVKLIKQRESVQELLEIVAEELKQRIDRFQQVEEGGIDPATMMRDLIFLEKWRATLKGIYGRLM
ncbi:MAG: J domain-containing protein [Verrucomicrobiota bacterium]